MDGKKLFEKYYSRLAFEGLIKALLLSLAIAFATTAAVALVLWLTGVKVLVLRGIQTGHESNRAEIG